MHNAPTYNVGIKYDLAVLTDRLIGKKIKTPLIWTNEIMAHVVPGKSATTKISSGGNDEARFNSERGGNNLLLKSGVLMSITENISLFTQIQYQQPLQKEGINFLNFWGGAKVFF